MKNNPIKYLTTSEADNNWGLWLNVAGSARIEPGSIYPPSNHPSEYYFQWENGRVLREYQINYITEGEGILENKYGTFRLKEGTIFITFPGIWHRYRPDLKTGWQENYIGFNGVLAEKLISAAGFLPEDPVYKPGVKEELMDTYLKIFDIVEKEQPAYQQIASGMVVKLLGYIISLDKQKGFSGKKISRVIEAIRFEIRQNLEKELDFKELAHRHHVSYSYFRKMFKKYTGVSPGQYHLQLKIIRAKELLISTDKSIKEIAYELGFQSIYYFSNLFKKKENCTPTFFRSRNRVE